MTPYIGISGSNARTFLSENGYLYAHLTPLEKYGSPYSVIYYKKQSK